MVRATINKADETRVFRNLNKLVAKVRSKAFHAGKQAGNEYCNLVKSGIGKTTSPWFVPDKWEPLSEYWKRIKTAHVEQFWIETGGIYQSIRTDVLLNTMLLIQIFAGIRKGTDPWAFERAMKNEYGYAKDGLGPPRPLFGPATDAIAIPIGAGQRKLTSASVKELFKGVVRQAVREVYG